MGEDLVGLRARSEHLAGKLAHTEALEVNRAILDAAPGDPVATNRLGAGLIAAGRAPEAVAVYEAGLEANAGNAIMVNRLTQARHAAGLRPVARASAARSTGRRRSGPTGWIKALQHDGDEWPDAPETRDWVNDAGKIDADGNRVNTASGTPWGAPSWKVDDPVGLCYGGTHKVAALVKVAAPPRFDPAFVEGRTGSAEEGRRRPWVTEVVGVSAVDLADAPSLTDLGIDNGSVQQRSRLKLDAERRDKMLQLLGP